MSLDHLLTEARNPASAAIDELSSIDIVRLMNAEDAKILPAVAACAEKVARAIDLIADRLPKGGRLVYIGAGTSGRLGVLDASECPPTFNSPPELVVGLIAGGPTALTKAVEGAEDHAWHAVADLKTIKLNAKDVLVGIATSGRTPYVIGGLRHAQSLGAVAIGLACTADSELVPVSDFTIEALVGPEVVTGSTRLKAGTATKLILNMLTTGAMIRMGKTYGNLMVDLRASNQKLIARTNRIVRMLTGKSAEQADETLKACDGELKTALVSALANLTPAEARNRLKLAGGRIKEALPMVEGSRPTLDLVIGVDGGGTKTQAMIADMNGKSLAEGFGGPSNPNAVELAVAVQSITDAIQSAFEKLGQSRGKVRAACLGLAGMGSPENRRLIADWAKKFGLAERVEVCTDADILLACHTQPNRIAVIAGTGSAVIAKKGDDPHITVGGWGPLLGDEGSAYDLTLAALKQIAHHHDHALPLAGFHNAILQAMGLLTAPQIVNAVYRAGWDRTRLADLAKGICASAATDGQARELLKSHTVRELADQIQTAWRRLGFATEGEVELILTGGMFEKNDLLFGLLQDELREKRGLHPHTIGIASNSVRGAVAEALRSIIP